MKIMKKNRKVSKVGLYTILVVFAIGLTIYPQTSSRYDYKEWDKLIYNSKLSELYVKGAVTAQWSADNFSENVVYFDVKFDRNPNMLNKEKDVYTNLSFTKKLSDGTVKKDAELCEVIWVKKASTGEEQFNFPIEYTTNETESFTARIKCRIDAITDVAADNTTWYAFNIAIKEKIDDDEYSFVYSSYDLSRQYDSNPIPEHPEVFTISKNSTTKLADFIKKMEDYATYTPWESVDEYFTGKLINYFKKSYTKEESICTSIPGLNIECTELTETDEIQFTLTAKPTLRGYARTRYAVDQNDAEYMFITSFTEEDLEEAFHYYLTTYTYPESSQAVELIHNYLHRFGATFKLEDQPVVAGGTRYRVIAVDEITKKEVILYGVLYSPTNRLIVTDSMLLNYAYNVKNHKIVMPVLDEFDLEDLFNKGLILVYSDWMTDKMVTALKADTRIYNSYTKNNSDKQTLVDFDDYFITAVTNEDNTTQYIMTHIYSNDTTITDKGEKYSVAELSIIDPNNITSATFPTVPTNIYLSALNADYQTDNTIFASIVTSLNTYFAQEMTVSFTTGSKATTGVYTVPSTYTQSQEETNE